MNLIPWTHTAREGFTLRGSHTAATGKPLLHFLHGNGFCGRVYEPMLRPLAQHFDLWLSDIQGHGDSDHGGRFVGWNRSADLAMEALQTQGKAFAQVPHYALGHSFGGALTGLMLGEHRQHFTRAMLLDPVLPTPAMIAAQAVADLTGMSKYAPLVKQALGRRNHWASRDEAYAKLHGRGIYKGWADEALHAFVNHALEEAAQGGVELKCSPQREAEIFGSTPTRLWSLLGHVRTPTMVLYATHTYPFVKVAVARWQSLNQAVSAQTFAGGHCFMQEKPEATAEVVRAFLLD
jgi:pimeloyl-ACP methyl ester carboxylesterase